MNTPHRRRTEVPPTRTLLLRRLTVEELPRQRNGTPVRLPSGAVVVLTEAQMRVLYVEDDAIRVSRHTDRQ